MTILDEFRQDDERVLDRLVDGELGLRELRELLAALDDEPAGWRRCALAFLEAQRWRWQLARAVSEPVPPTPVERPSALERTGHHWFGGLLAVAAGLLAAFYMGTLVSGRAGPSVPLAAQPSRAIEPLRGAAPRQAIAEPSLTAPVESAAVESAAEAPWETVTLTPLDGSNDPIQLRVVKTSRKTSTELAGVPTALSTRLSDTLEREGWRVDRRQGLVPIELSDGRWLEVPVEEIHLQSPESVQF